MGEKDFYSIGDWNAICDMCGQKFKASELHLNWEGFRVCKDCWEPQHPQDFVRGKVDRQRVPWSRPDQDMTFETTTTKTTALVPYDTVVTVTALGSAADYMNIGIQTDVAVQDASGITNDNVTSAGYIIHWSVISDISTLDITFIDPIMYNVAIGNTVYFMTNSNHLSVGDVTVAGDFKV